MKTWLKKFVDIRSKRGRHLRDLLPRPFSGLNEVGKTLKPKAALILEK